MRRLAAVAVVSAAAGSKQLSKPNTYDMRGQHSPCRAQRRRRQSFANEIEMHFVCAETRVTRRLPRRPVCRLRINIFYCLEKCVLVKTS